MVSTKWFQGKENLSAVKELRNKVFVEEKGINQAFVSDFYDEFGLNVVVYDDGEDAGTGRLIFVNGKYTIDKLCVLKKFRGNNYGELLVRMLVRKAVTLGADKTYISATKDHIDFFEKIDFEILNYLDDEVVEMVKVGDVGGCC